jgi:mRNA interferase MazF
MSYKFGEVVLIQFPFTNQQGKKSRPAVVVSSHAYNENKPDVILAAITSQIHTPISFGEALIYDWQSAGLLKPSLLKPVLFTAEKSMLTKSLGTLSANDQQALQQVLEQIID